MKTVLTRTTAVLAVLAAASGRAEEPPMARRTPTPLQVRVVVARKQAGSALARLPYTLTCNAEDDRRSSLRMGVEVPIAVGGGKGVQYRNVGMNIDCQAATLEEGRYRLQIGFEQSSVSELGAARVPPTPSATADRAPDDALAAGNPMFRTFNSMFTAILRDGQSAVQTVATDPVTGEEVTIEVALKRPK